MSRWEKMAVSIYRAPVSAINRMVRGVAQMYSNPAAIMEYTFLSEEFCNFPMYGVCCNHVLLYKQDWISRTHNSFTRLSCHPSETRFEATYSFLFPLSGRLAEVVWVQYEL